MLEKIESKYEAKAGQTRKKCDDIDGTKYRIAVEKIYDSADNRRKAISSSQEEKEKRLRNKNVGRVNKWFSVNLFCSCTRLQVENHYWRGGWAFEGLSPLDKIGFAAVETKMSAGECLHLGLAARNWRMALVRTGRG